jgi:hypothetical protein
MVVRDGVVAVVPPSRWACDALAAELRAKALAAAERELKAAWMALDQVTVDDWSPLDRYIAALEVRNAFRGGRR